MRISRYTLFLAAIILVGPILDLMTGFLTTILQLDTELTPGVFYRGMILIPLFTILVLKLKSNYFRIIAAYFFFVFFLGLFTISVSTIDIDLVDHLQRFLKIVFPLLGFGALVYLGKKYPHRVSHRLLWLFAGLYGLLTAAAIVLFFILGIGVSTYRVGFSSIAFFDSQNSMGLILVAGVSSTLYYVFQYKRNSLILIMGADGLFLLSAFLVGTRAGIVGVIVAMIAFHLFTFFKRGTGQRIPPLVYSLMIVSGVLVSGLMIYSYWSTHYDVNFILNKFELVFNNDGFAYGTEHFRAKVPLGLEEISQLNFVQHLFGIGDTAFLLTENDFVDIYGKFGLLVLIPLLFFFMYYYLGVLIVFFKKRTLSSFILLISLTFYILHAAVAGHALAIAQTNNLMILFYYLTYLEMRAYPIRLFRKKPYLKGLKVVY